MLAPIEKRLEGTNLMGRYVVGTRYDSKIKQAMDEIAESKTLLEAAVLADDP